MWKKSSQKSKLCFLVVFGKEEKVISLSLWSCVASFHQKVGSVKMAPKRTESNSVSDFLCHNWKPNTAMHNTKQFLSKLELSQNLSLWVAPRLATLELTSTFFHLGPWCRPLAAKSKKLLFSSSWSNAIKTINCACTSWAEVSFQPISVKENIFSKFLECWYYLQGQAK